MWISSFLKEKRKKLLKRLFFLHWMLLAPLLKIIWAYIWGLISRLNILFSLSTCLSLSWYHTVWLLCSKFWNQEMVVLQFYYSFSQLFWLYGLPCNSIWIFESPFPFLQNKKTFRILIGITRIWLWVLLPLTIFILPIHECVSSHLLLSLFICFNGIL